MLMLQCNSAGFNPGILRILRAADEAVLKKYQIQIPLSKEKKKHKNHSEPHGMEVNTTTLFIVFFFTVMFFFSREQSCGSLWSTWVVAQHLTL
jgi:hypothetical protein